MYTQDVNGSECREVNTRANANANANANSDASAIVPIRFFCIAIVRLQTPMPNS